MIVSANQSVSAASVTGLDDLCTAMQCRLQCLCFFQYRFPATECRLKKQRYPALKARIEAEQKAVWSNLPDDDKDAIQRGGAFGGRNTYGPLLVMLKPDKQAVLVRLATTAGVKEERPGRGQGRGVGAKHERVVRLWKCLFLPVRNLVWYVIESAGYFSH